MNTIHINLTYAAYAVAIHELPEGKTADDIVTYYLEDITNDVTIEFRDGTKHTFKVDLDYAEIDYGNCTDLTIEEADEARDRRYAEFCAREQP